jgi:hypothetical protein
MAYFDLSAYQTVQERIDLFWELHPNGRFNLEIVSMTPDQVVIKSEVWTDIAEEKPRAVDFAEERFGSSPVNKSSYIENCATSSLGRCISQLGGALSPKGKKASAEEMAKVNRVNNRDWIAEADALALVYNLDGLRKLYSEAVANRVLPEIVEKIKTYGNDLAGSQDSGSESVRGKGTAS